MKHLLVLDIYFEKHIMAAMILISCSDLGRTVIGIYYAVALGPQVD